MFTIYSDPHHGVNLRANTTYNSRIRLREAVGKTAHTIVKKYPDDTVICVGDFYDTYTNSEETLLASAETARLTDYILGGNHDVKNDVNDVGSFHLMANLINKNAVIPSVSTPTFTAAEVKGVLLVFVPHHGTQTSFEEALENCKQKASSKEDMKAMLFLHCNYNSSFATRDSELNLTRETAESLLQVFDLIFLGHEHRPFDDFGGRLRVVGTPHPLSFSDCDSSKRFLRVTKDSTGELEVTSEETWTCGHRFVDTTPANLVDEQLEDVNFLRVRGNLSPSEMLPLAKAVKNIFSENENMFAVKVDVQFMSQTTINTDAETSTKLDEGTEKITDIITAELQKQSPELLALWQEVVAEKGELQ